MSAWLQHRLWSGEVTVTGIKCDRRCLDKAHKDYGYEDCDTCKGHEDYDPRRRCLWCNSPLDKGPNESNSNFNKRETCNHQCAGMLREKRMRDRGKGTHARNAYGRMDG